MIDDAGGHDFAIGFGIQRDAASETKILGFCFFQGQAHNVQHGVFTQVLYGISDIFVQVADIAFRLTRRAQCFGPTGIGIAARSMEKFGVRLVRRSTKIEERAEVDARLSVWRKAHDFPLVGVGDEAEEGGERGVEESERIGPVDGEDGINATVCAMPNGSGFPCAAAIHDDDGGIVKTGIGIGAEGVGEMMIDETKAGLGAKFAEKEFAPPFWCHMLAKWRVEFRTFK